MAKLFSRNSYESISINKYFKIINPSYTYLKVTPHTSSKNNNTDQIAMQINQVYTSALNRIHKEDKTFISTKALKVSYYIYIEKDKVEFYFIVPTVWLKFFKQKITSSWSYVEIREVEEVPFFSAKATKLYLNYRKEDALSLKIDRRNNDLLTAQMSVIDILESESNDKVGILYNFVPSSKAFLKGYSEYHKEILQKYKEHKPLDKKETGIKNTAIRMLYYLFNTIDCLLGEFKKDLKDSVEINQVNALLTNTHRELDNATHNKQNLTICKTQIVVLSESDNKMNEYINARALGESFNILSGDNMLEYREFKNDEFNLLDPVYKEKINYSIGKEFRIGNNLYIGKKISFGNKTRNLPLNKTSSLECSNFISLPGRELISSYKNIDHAKIQEKEIPLELLKGTIHLGQAKYKDRPIPIFKSEEGQLGKLGMILFGGMGAGKTTLLTNISSNIVKSGHGQFVIDYIGDCDLSSNIEKITPKEQLVVIDYSKLDDIQSFAYNEMEIDLDNMAPEDIKKQAMKKAELIYALLNSVNAEDKQLSPKMARFLSSAGVVVFSTKSDASLKDIISCLSSPSKRADFISKLKPAMRDILMEDIETLGELDKVDKENVVIGNNDSKVEGILDRCIYLRSNYYTQNAYSRSSKNNYDFRKLIKENKTVLIKMPQTAFPSTDKTVRNVISTFILSKVWLAKQMLGESGNKYAKTYLIFDEIHQSQNCQVLFKDIMVEARKFSFVPIIAIHYLQQFNDIECRKAVLNSGLSFLLLQGTGVSGFKDFAKEFENQGFSELDLLNLEQFHALALIKTKSNLTAFVTKLPKPLKIPK